MGDDLWFLYRWATEVTSYSCFVTHCDVWRRLPIVMSGVNCRRPVVSALVAAADSSPVLRRTRRQLAAAVSSHLGPPGGCSVFGIQLQRCGTVEVARCSGGGAAFVTRGCSGFHRSWLQHFPGTWDHHLPAVLWRYSGFHRSWLQNFLGTWDHHLPAVFWRYSQRCAVFVTGGCGVFDT